MKSSPSIVKLKRINDPVHGAAGKLAARVNIDPAASSIVSPLPNGFDGQPGGRADVSRETERASPVTCPERRQPKRSRKTRLVLLAAISLPKEK